MESAVSLQLIKSDAPQQDLHVSLRDTHPFQPIRRRIYFAYTNEHILSKIFFLNSFFKTFIITIYIRVRTYFTFMILSQDKNTYVLLIKQSCTEQSHLSLILLKIFFVKKVGNFVTMSIDRFFIMFQRSILTFWKKFMFAKLLIKKVFTLFE